MTELEIVSAVLNSVTSHEGVTNFSLSEEQIADDLNTLRARMVMEMDKVGLFRRPFLGFTQTIPAVVVKSNGKEPSTAEIPRLISLRGNTVASVYIGGDDGRNPYRVVTGESSENETHDQFIGKLPIVLYQEGHLTITNAPASEKIKVIGVFERPSDLAVFDNGDAPLYDDKKTNYPMTNATLDELIGKLVNDYIRTLYRFPPQANTQSDIPNARPVNG